MPRDRDWDIHKDDPNWPYDEFGFPKGQKPDPQVWAFMQIADHMFGDPDPVIIKENYDEEFRQYIPPLLRPWTRTGVREYEFGTLGILVGAVIGEHRFYRKVHIDMLNIKTGTQFNEELNRALRHAAYLLTRDVENGPPPKDAGAS